MANIVWSLPSNWKRVFIVVVIIVFVVVVVIVVVVVDVLILINGVKARITVTE